jgi:hypothetical protein
VFSSSGLLKLTVLGGANDDRSFIVDEVELIGRIAPGLASLRAQVRDAVTLALDPNDQGFLNQSLDTLDNAEALLDAYATLAFPDALNRSEVLRSALRGFSDVGLRRENVLLALAEAEQNDNGELGGATPLDIPGFPAEWHARLEVLRSEIDAALADPGPFDPYVEHTLAELQAARDGAFDLAREDTYAAFGQTTVNAADGLLANDVKQAGRVVEVDLGFFASPAYTPPTNGSVTVNPDGSFTYTPDPGFLGEDTFNYRATAMIDANAIGDPNAYSAPVDVVIRVTDIAPCPTDLTGDGATDLADLLAVLASFGIDAGGDVNNDNATDLADLLAVLAEFGNTCTP